METLSFIADICSLVALAYAVVIERKISKIKNIAQVNARIKDWMDAMGTFASRLITADREATWVVVVTAQVASAHSLVETIAAKSVGVVRKRAKSLFRDLDAIHIGPRWWQLWAAPTPIDVNTVNELYLKVTALEGALLEHSKTVKKLPWL